MDSVFSGEHENRSRIELLRDLVIHLRLHYQLLLAPIFLWGYFLAGRRPDLDFWLAFLAFHVFGYGGGTAYNSYYDRDEGPIGGLSDPPPVHATLLPFSLGVQAAGALLSAAVNAQFLAVYLIMFVLGIAYSHPNIRLKRRPFIGLATVGLGQGVLASLGGWLSATPSLTAIGAVHVAGIAAVTLVTVGFYPLTQIYQIEVDRERGDITFAVRNGPRRAFVFATSVQAIAALILVTVVVLLLDWSRGLLVAGFYIALLAVMMHWSRTFDSTRVIENYRRIMYIQALTSAGFGAFVGLHLFGFLPR